MIVVVPDKIVGVNVVDVDVGLEKLPPVEDQEIEVPIPAKTAFRFIISPFYAVKSAIGSMVGAGLTTTVKVVGKAH